jgi:N-acetyl-anhydromuramyl-L-alanine amidase AmpD
MLNIIKYDNFKSIGKNYNKKQIILTHTSTKLENYLTGLKYRFNKSYSKIPNYIVDTDGRVIHLLENEDYSEFFQNSKINQNSIIISLENLGWLNKEPLNNHYVNWIGDIYKGKVFERKWRERFFWHPYTTYQIESLAKLCNLIFENTKIEKNVLGHNTKINGIEKFKGVVTRSNFYNYFTDVNPSFDFELFIKKIEDEQFT